MTKLTGGQLSQAAYEASINPDVSAADAAALAALAAEAYRAGPEQELEEAA